jgi:hypothetical protein
MHINVGVPGESFTGDKKVNETVWLERVGHQILIHADSVKSEIYVNLSDLQRAMVALAVE